MKTTSIISTLAAAALPALAAPAPRSAPTTFAGLSIHSGSSIQYSSINANSNAFWLNKPTSSYCPETITSCPTGNSTSFSLNSSSTALSLNVEVPGGQAVYVAADGHLGFTVAHSAAIPAGASTDAFKVDGKNLQHDGRDWVACAQEGEPEVYKIYAASNGASPTNCTAFAFYMETATEVGAWEYE